MKKVFTEKVSYFFNPPPPEPKKRHGLRLKPIDVIFEIFWYMLGYFHMYE